LTKDVTAVNRNLMIPLACAIALSGCVFRGPKPAPPPAKSDAVASLPAQTLAAGECGLFLWTADAPNRFVFFAKSNNTAKVLLPTGSENLSLATQGGTLFGQFMTRSTYAAPGKTSVSVSLEPGEVIEGGQRAKSARLRFSDAKGWETVMPVVGLTHCDTGVQDTPENP
jgi:hypothetical protein